MRKIIYVCTLIFCSLFYSQKKEAVVFKIDSSRNDFTKVQNHYYDLLNKSKTFIYEKGGYSYYSKSRYDSLIKINLADSIVLDNSIIKVSTSKQEYYIMKFSGLKSDNYNFYKYKGNQLLSMERLDQFLETYSKNDFNALTIYSYCGKSDCIYEYQFAKFSKLNSEKQLADVLYSMRIDRMGAVYEQFYDKDFPIDEKTLLKIFMTKFIKQAVPLMKGVKYSRGHGSPNKEFDTKDLEYEIEYFKRNITEKQKATAGFYDKKEIILKFRAEGGVGTVKTYDTANKPFYRVIFNYDMKRWQFKINPTTGDIEKIEFDLVYE